MDAASRSRSDGCACVHACVRGLVRACVCVYSCMIVLTHMRVGVFESLNKFYLDRVFRFVLVTYRASQQAYSPLRT